jgi:hypothetical protein
MSIHVCPRDPGETAGGLRSPAFSCFVDCVRRERVQRFGQLVSHGIKARGLDAFYLGFLNASAVFFAREFGWSEPRILDDFP